MNVCDPQLDWVPVTTALELFTCRLSFGDFCTQDIGGCFLSFLLSSQGPFRFPLLFGFLELGFFLDDSDNYEYKRENAALVPPFKQRNIGNKVRIGKT
jgi:hypothetical protein